jgi:hypothetical protein
MMTTVGPVLQILSPQLIHNTHPDRLRWSNAKMAVEKVGADLPAFPPPKLSSLSSPAECPPAKIGGCAAVKKCQVADHDGRTVCNAAADVARSLAEFEALLGAIVHVTVTPARCDKLCFGLCAENPLTCYWLRWQQAPA